MSLKLVNNGLYEAKRKDTTWIRFYFSNLEIFNGLEISLKCLAMIKLSMNWFKKKKKKD